MGREIGRPTRPPGPPEDAYDMTLEELRLACRHRLWRGKPKEEDYQRRLDLFFATLPPHLPLARIRKRHLEDAQETLLARPNGRGGTYSPATVNRIMVAGSKAFGWAVDNEYLVGKPKFPLLDEDNEKNAWVREQDVPRFAEFILEHCGWRHAVALMTLLVCGLRVGELTHLTPRQIEQEWDGRWYLRLKAKNTKTKKPRSVPIPESLAKPLLEMLEDGLGAPPYSQLLRACRAATVALNLPDSVTPHVLRHTAATLMTRKGVPTATVAKLLGHANIRTTQRYDHWIPATNPLVDIVQSDSNSLPENRSVPLKLPDSYPKVGPSLHERFVKWGKIGAERRSGGLGGNRTPVQGFAVHPVNTLIPRKPLKSRDKKDD